MEFKTLQELCTEIIDCPHTTPEWKTEGIPVIRNYNLQNGFIDKSKLSFVDNDTYLQRIKRGMPQVDDIIFSREAPVGSVAIMPSNFRCCLGQRLVLLKVNKSICDPHYLLYVMLSNFVKKQYKTVEKTGSIVSNFNIGDLKNLVIPYVDIAIQKKFGKMCGMLDRKIAVNNLTIENLESMAKTLYDYWFVQFDFPDANGNPYKTSGGKMEWNETLSREIPAGWSCESVKDNCDVQYGYPFDTNLFSEKKGVPVVRIRDIQELSMSAYTTEAVDKKYQLKRNDLIVGMDGNFHMNFWAGKEALLNQRIFRIRGTEDISTLSIYFAIKPYIEHREKNVTRTTVGHLSDYDVKSLKLILPEDIEFRKKIATKFEGILNHITNIREENWKLTSLRDYLLPMLMNGQVTFRQ